MSPVSTLSPGSAAEPLTRGALPRNGHPREHRPAQRTDCHTPPPAPEATAAQAPTPRTGLLGQFVPAFLAFALVFWNALLLFLMIWLTPKNDFGRTYYSAVLWVQGEDMYALNRSVPWYIDDETINLWNLNPPHFHVLLLPLVPLPDLTALALWCGLNAFCLVIACGWIMKETGLTMTPGLRKWGLLGLLGFIGTGTALVTGHMSFLIFMLVTRVWIDARRGNWNRAGIWLGLALSVKPFLLIILPYLVLRRRWNGLASALATALGCFALGLAVFGIDGLMSWRNTLAQAETWSWLPMNGSIMGLLTRTFSHNLIFGEVAELPPALISALWLAIGIPVGLLTLGVSLTDSSPRGVDRAFALLLVGALLLSPLGWTYYFWLPVGPLVALSVAWWRDDRESASPWSRRLLVASLPGFMLPLHAVVFFQKSPAATLITGSVYFWSLLLAWLALIVDGLRAYLRRNKMPATPEPTRGPLPRLSLET